MLINSQQDALELFCAAATRHAEATETGDYYSCNKAYDQIIQALHWLEIHKAANLLADLLASSNVGIQLWAASFLLFHQCSEAEETLAALASRKDLHGFTATMTLIEWRGGRLRPLTT